VVFEEPERYYQPEDGRYWQQGDIVLAPVGLFTSDADSLNDADPAPLPGNVIRRLIWSENEELNAKKLVAEAQLSPAVVTTHNCTMDKDFLRRYRELRRDGIAKEEARHRAAEDDSLDPHLNLAPIVPFGEAAPSAPTELLANKVIGFFPICGSPERGIDEGVANLLHETTIEKSLIVDRLGVMTEEAIAALRYAIARFWVYRAPKLTFELERAVGKRITEISISTDESLAIDLELDDGEVIRFIQAPHVEQQGVERPGLP
jgi:hypothetical protein